MAHAAGTLGKALIVVLCVAWQLLAHASVSGGAGDSLRYALIAAPVALLAYWIARNAGNRMLWLAVLAAGTAAVLALERSIHLGLAAATGLPHAAVYVFLLFLFGHTLLAGHEPLVTRLARRVHGELPPRIEAYTRRVTIAWCVFFAAQLCLSAVLFAYAALDAWSLFVNVLNAPLVVLMFAGEYAYRVARYRDFPHATLAQTVRAFTRDAAGGRGARRQGAAWRRRP